MDIKNRIEKLYIKLGSNCNFNCKYCHSKHFDIKFNPDIVPLINKLGIHHVTLSGGEPLLYWDIVEQIVSGCDNNTLFRMTTNGTLFTQEIIDFCNRYKFFISISLDGDNSARNTDQPICWNLISQLKVVSATATIYNENRDIRETLASLNEYKKKYLTVPANILSTFPNFVHSTQDTGVLTKHEFAVSYVEQMTDLFDEAFETFKNTGHKSNFLRRGLEVYCKPKTGHGIRCCRETNICMLANGDIYVCPYTLAEKVGDIFHFDEINFEDIEERYTRPGCKTCKCFSVCKNTCCMSVTGDECYVMRQLHNAIANLIEKHNIPLEKLKYVFNMPLQICK